MQKKFRGTNTLRRLKHYDLSHNFFLQYKVGFTLQHVIKAQREIR